jgi:uncharacterized protein (TIGR02271 family)
LTNLIWALTESTHIGPAMRPAIGLGPDDAVALIVQRSSMSSKAVPVSPQCELERRTLLLLAPEALSPAVRGQFFCEFLSRVATRVVPGHRCHRDRQFNPLPPAPGSKAGNVSVSAWIESGEEGINMLGDNTSGTAATMRDTVAVKGEERLQLAEEQLNVGKRLVNRGTTRVRRFVVEQPVEQDVTLHSERVTVERRPVSDDVRASEGFADKIVEVTETDEEPVVGKTARVKEEVVVRKEASDRVETVRDKVRREDVEVTNDDQVTKDTGSRRSSSGSPRRP